MMCVMNKYHWDLFPAIRLKKLESHLLLTRLIDIVLVFLHIFILNI